jgi:Fe-S-cluster containining protein
MIEVTNFHARADLYVAKCLVSRPHLKPCCAIGCFACCSEAVYAGEAEALHILEYLTPEQTAEVKMKLPEWLAKTRPVMNQHQPDAMDYRRLNAPCVLLKNGLCSIYPRRPLGCRTWYALKNPSDCDLPQRQHQKYAEFMPGLAVACGLLAVNGVAMLDHLGVLLAENLLGLSIPSASRETCKPSEIKFHAE